MVVRRPIEILRRKAICHEIEIDGVGRRKPDIRQCAAVFVYRILRRVRFEIDAATIKQPPDLGGGFWPEALHRSIRGNRLWRIYANEPHGHIAARSLHMNRVAIHYSSDWVRALKILHRL